MPGGTPSKPPPVLRRRRDSTTSGLERQASCPVIVTATPPSVTEPSLNSAVELRSCAGTTSALQPVTDEQPSEDPPSNDDEETDEGGGLH